MKEDESQGNRTGMHIMDGKQVIFHRPSQWKQVPNCCEDCTAQKLLLWKHLDGSQPLWLASLLLQKTNQTPPKDECWWSLTSIINHQYNMHICLIPSPNIGLGV
jgi:hypothetical protein